MNITKISISRPTLIIVLFSVFTLMGIVGYFNLNYELLPDFNQPVVVIKTLYPGAEPKEVESSLSRKIEDALSNLEGVDYIETKSMPNASLIIINLKYGVNLANTMQDAQRFIDNIKRNLPAEIEGPEMSKISPNDLPIIYISAQSKQKSTTFYQQMKDNYLPRLQQLRGVAEITLIGGEEREIQVKVDQFKLVYYKISLNQIIEAINRSGLDVPAGQLQTDKISNSVRLTGKFENIEQIMNVQVGMNSFNSPIYVKDIANVNDGIKDITSVSRFNTKNGIGLLIKKQGDANAVEVSKLVRNELSKIENDYKASGLKFIIADDSTENTIHAVNSVVFDLFLAVILVSIVMLLFLRSYRNSLIVLISIPTSLVTAFAVMWLMGYTLNLMTLLAMSLIIGILVDDAIVVLENIQRHLDMGKEKRSAAIEGRMEIGYSAISITLVDVVVFLPILFLQVFVADMLKQFSVVVITSTLTSLLVGFTLTPWLASRIGKKEDLLPKNVFNKFLLFFDLKLQSFIEWYGKILEWVLNNKLIFTSIVIVLFILTFIIQNQGIIGTEMMQTGDQGKFKINLEFDKSITLYENNLNSLKIENYLLSMPEVKTVFSNIGGPSTGIGSTGLGSAYRTEFTIQLVNAEKRADNTEEFMKYLKTELSEKYPNINFSMAVLGLLPKSAPIKITLSGENFEDVLKNGKKLKNIISEIPGADNVKLSIEEGTPEFKVVPNQEKMQRFGITTGYLGMTLRNAITGNSDASITQNGNEYDINIRLDDFDRMDYEDLNRLKIINLKNQPIEISQFATIIPDNSPSMLERLDRQTSVTITAESFGRPSGTLAKDVKTYLKDKPLAENIKLTWGADIKTQNESFGALGSVLIISFILIYLIMVALYDSYLYPFVALFGIPSAVIGAFLALNLSLNNITLFAQLGLIMLMGLVTKNAILIVDFTNQLKAQGMNYKDALINAGKERMRPILMTTLAMAIGMLPIALAKGTASEWKNGLAWVIIGGLLSSLIITVFLVPVVYYTVDSIKERLSRMNK
ncbi:MAG: acriflavin resistance protein [Ignavibacteria bacterium GWF2_33_9]|nr:MAG: acriflavin resistance protein [Ignavibacteria bacterium GWF2_33_9]